MLTRANLLTEIAKRRVELRRLSNVSAQEVIAALAAQMRGDITELLSKVGSFDLPKIILREFLVDSRFNLDLKVSLKQLGVFVIKGSETYALLGIL